MTWSISHRIPYVATTDYDGFWTYMWDTYLSSKGWTVGAGSDAQEREVGYDLMNAWTGSKEAWHWRVDWVNATGAYLNIYNYINYSSGGANSNQNYQTGANGSQTEFQFWTSTEDPNAALVTGGKGTVIYFWPGDSARWFLRGNQEGGVTGEKTYPGPLGSVGWKYYGWQADPADTNTANRYNTLGYLGFNGEDRYSDSPPIPAGAKTMRVRNPILGVTDTNVLQGDNTRTYNTRGPIVQLTSADVFLQFACGTVRQAKAFNPSSIGFDGTNYFYGGAGTSNRFVFECGTTEPIF